MPNGIYVYQTNCGTSSVALTESRLGSHSILQVSVFPDTPSSYTHHRAPTHPTSGLIVSVAWQEVWHV